MQHTQHTRQPGAMRPSGVPAAVRAKHIRRVGPRRAGGAEQARRKRGARGGRGRTCSARVPSTRAFSYLVRYRVVMRCCCAAGAAWPGPCSKISTCCSPAGRGGRKGRGRVRAGARHAGSAAARARRLSPAAGGADAGCRGTCCRGRARHARRSACAGPVYTPASSCCCCSSPSPSSSSSAHGFCSATSSSPKSSKLRLE